MVILDSDILVGFLRGDEKAKEKIAQLAEKEALSTTAINSFELFKGAFLSRRREENLKEVGSMLQNLNILSFDYRTSLVCANKFKEISDKRKEISLADLIIASIAISEGERLITRNEKDFGIIDGLRIEVW